MTASSTIRRSAHTWDFENRLSSVNLPANGGTVSFTYDPFGRRIQKISPSGATIYLYDGVNIVAEVGTSGAVVASYAQGLGVDQPLAMQRGGYTAYYQADGLGSITSLSGSIGQPVATYNYHAFGATTATEGIFNPYRYTGREQDPETGLYYYRARYYDPNIGRFISEDPIGSKGSGTNFYAYVRNNPIKLIDPLGLCPEGPQNGPKCLGAALVAGAESFIGLPPGVPSSSGAPISELVDAAKQFVEQNGGATISAVVVANTFNAFISNPATRQILAKVAGESLPIIGWGILAYQTVEAASDAYDTFESCIASGVDH